MRHYNFCAGPSALPTEVLTEVQQELLDWHNMGCSAMEVSHRSPAFIALGEQFEADLRRLLDIPDDYAVIFSSGGASAHSAFIPLNLLGEHDHADYIVTGAWSEKSYREGCRYGAMRLAVNSGPEFRTIPSFDSWQLSPQAAYCHLASNETIHGVQFKEFPQLEVPLVVDMSSDILSKPIDIRQFGVVYAGAQKNIGPAGMTIVIIRRDLLGRTHPYTPTVFNYTTQSQCGSMANTPPTFNWYITAKIIQRLLQTGGLVAMAQRTQAKSQHLYEALDRSALFYNPVDPNYRSDMVVPFFLRDDSLTTRFLTQAAEHQLIGLKGHQLIGGVRASLYNAVSLEAVYALVAFMQDFENRH